MVKTTAQANTEVTPPAGASRRGAVDQLMEYVRARDPHRGAPKDLAALQLAAIRERFAERRQQIRTLDKRAKETGVDEIRTFQDVVPVLFSHTNYKSYPEAFVDSGRWKNMSAWLRTLCTYPTDDIDVAGVRDVDDWIARARDAGHYLFASSGTSGKSSFLDQSTSDRNVSTTAFCNCVDSATPGYAPNHDRSVFTMLPSKGPYKTVDESTAHLSRWAAPGELHRFSDEPIRAMDSMRPAQLRRLLAAGKVGPGEVAAYEEEVAVKQQRRAQQMEVFLDKLVARRHSPLYLGFMWSSAWQIAEKLRARGITDGDFHPDTILAVSGGTKGVVLPADYKAQVTRFYGLTPDRVGHLYGMTEVTGLCPEIQPHGVFAIPPWLVPLVLDKAGERLLNPADGKGVVEGRMAFFDVLADARWGGIISGDKVQVEFGSGLDEVKTPVIRSIARYMDLAEGEDKLTCAGSIDGYVRGAIGAEV